MIRNNRLDLIHRETYSSLGPLFVAVGLFLTVCGTLRITDGFGIGELLLLVFAIVGWFKGERITLMASPFAWFWCLLALLMSLGYFFNELVGNWVRRDAIAYLYTGCISLGLVLYLRDWSSRQLKIFLRTLFVVTLTMLWLGFVIYISGDQDLIQMLHMDDKGDARYTAWSTNANQLALFFVPLPIWLLLLNLRNASLRRSICWWGMLLGTMLMGLIVRSDALVLSWGVGLLLLMGLDWFWCARKELRLLVLLAMLAVGALLVAKAFTSGDVRKTFQCSFSAAVRLESPIEMGCVAGNVFSGVESLRTGYSSSGSKTEIRLGLWKNALTVIEGSPWVGHGPGAFSWYEDATLQASEEAAGKNREEAHNIPLDLMTQGGVFLGLAWVALLGWLLVGAWRVRSAYVFTWVFVLGFFTLFMYHLRHPYLWFCLILASEFIRRRLGVIPEKLDKSV